MPSKMALPRSRTQLVGLSRSLSTRQSHISSMATQQTHSQRLRPTALPNMSRGIASTACCRTSAQVPANKQKSRSAAEWKGQSGPDGPDLNLLYVKTTDASWHPVFIRDLCACPRCVDPSTKQKTFQTTDIPADIEAASIKESSSGDLTVTWTKDLPGFGPDHVTTIPKETIGQYDNRGSYDRSRSTIKTWLWNAAKIKEHLKVIQFQEYMNDDQQLLLALRSLQQHGLLILRGVPDMENAVEDITGRIGHIRDTFYGRTWDVKSVPNAKNVAYTANTLGLHMDLLYMQNVPGFQFLHCLRNTSPGGESLFADANHAVDLLSERSFNLLADQNIAFEYRNDGHYYYLERPILELGKRKSTVQRRDGSERTRAEVLNINWSPPFQAGLPFVKRYQGSILPKVLQAMREFSDKVNSPAAVYSYRMNEGDCVIFNNRRILHGRRAFKSDEGERWLKGAYVDTDVLRSRLRVVSEQLQGTVDYSEFDRNAQYVHPRDK